MYNGIGLRTARGTGTNGYVQKNLSFLKPKSGNGSGKAPYDYNYEDEATHRAQRTRKPSDEVLLHKARRMVEVEVLEFRESLEAENKYTEEELEEKVQQKRQVLLKRLEEEARAKKDDVVLVEKEREMIKMKEAFGIRKDFEEGRGFRFDTEKQRQQKLERQAAEEKNHRFKPY